MKLLKKGNRFINIVDIVNMVLAAIIIVCTVFLFVDITHNQKLFFLIFLLSAIMNICMAIKYYKRYDAPRTIALSAFAVILLVLAVVSFVSIF